ncbi:hypothetical protein FACS1894195_1680 [Bacteroidia bacterium]|nr:hypothetical protein FACS1894195_1680 [Bacteroidia bacterium]
MAKLETKNKQNPKLRQRVLIDGRSSLYLEYYLGRKEITDVVTGKTHIQHNRKKVNLNLYLESKPKNAIEKQENKDILEIAQEVRNQRERELKFNKSGITIKNNKDEDIWDFLQNIYDRTVTEEQRAMYSPRTFSKRKQKILGTIRRFKNFIKINYPFSESEMTFSSLTKAMMQEFVQYLTSIGFGGGPAQYWAYWKHYIAKAIDEDLLMKNPCTGISIKVDRSTIKKDILSEEEVATLIKFTGDKQDMEVRRGFIFSLYTGIRFCDLKALKFKNVDYSNKTLKFEQIKTKGHSSASAVTTPLSTDLLKLIGQNPTDIEQLIFNLPPYNTCIRHLGQWVKAAQINKHITWHCARHSFAVNILNNGANIKTVSSLLGHSGLTHTEKYTRAVDSLKVDAINSLHKIKW